MSYTLKTNYLYHVMTINYIQRPFFQTWLSKIRIEYYTMCLDNRFKAYYFQSTCK